MTKGDCTFSPLIGLTVKAVTRVHDYYQIEFSDATRLSIFNALDVKFDSINMIEGKRLSALDQSGARYRFSFEEMTLDVSLQDDAYSGPEAMVLNRPGKETVVIS